MEHGLVTAGDDLNSVPQFLSQGHSHYTAADVISILLNGYKEDIPQSHGCDSILEGKTHDLLHELQVQSDPHAIHQDDALVD